jgi:putative FmdB family regulatory protein
LAGQRNDERVVMPTYEYACSKCGEHLEAVQSFSDDPLKKCPACGGRLKKVYGNVGIVFKGSGFYKTDSRNAQKASKATAASEKAASSDKSGSSDSGSSPDSSSKPATTGTDNGKKSATKDTGSSSKSEGSTRAPAAAS